MLKTALSVYVCVLYFSSVLLVTRCSREHIHVVAHSCLHSLVVCDIRVVRYLYLYSAFSIDMKKLSRPNR